MYKTHNAGGGGAGPDPVLREPLQGHAAARGPSFFQFQSSYVYGDGVFGRDEGGCLMVPGGPIEERRERRGRSIDRAYSTHVHTQMDSQQPPTSPLKKKKHAHRRRASRPTRTSSTSPWGSPSLWRSTRAWRAGPSTLRSVCIYHISWRLRGVVGWIDRPGLCKMPLAWSLTEPHNSLSSCSNE